MICDSGVTGQRPCPASRESVLRQRNPLPCLLEIHDLFETVAECTHRSMTPSIVLGERFQRPGDVAQRSRWGAARPASTDSWNPPFPPGALFCCRMHPA
jgi:hypothetical protein